MPGGCWSTFPSSCATCPATWARCWISSNRGACQSGSSTAASPSAARPATTARRTLQLRSDDGDDIDTWDFSGEVEYLIPDSAASVYGGLGFGSLHPDSTDETDTFRIGAGFRVHFGTQGSLRDRNRAEPVVGALKTEFTY